MMGADQKDRNGVLGDSQATLRQVASALTDLGDVRAVVSTEEDDSLEKFLNRMEDRPLGLGELVEVLVRAYSEIMGVIEGLRQSRGLLENAAMKRLKRTHQKLLEVSSATEVAASGMLDGLDRALVLVDSLETMEGSSTDESDEARTELRDELHGLMDLLQFQDITAQQLGYAGQVLEELEGRLMRIASIFDVSRLGVDEAPKVATLDDEAAEIDPEEHGVHDPKASTLDADSRQAVADEIFK